ncbi:hypothetical protein PG997_012595 [Apiospora hydei]|uniref:Uncharacterized protein n=1 Tax=Apiospora hydei TaxID=1337664 RepID=A0ABR1V3T6_9PEZI
MLFYSCTHKAQKPRQSVLETWKGDQQQDARLYRPSKELEPFSSIAARQVRTRTKFKFKILDSLLPLRQDGCNRDRKSGAFNWADADKECWQVEAANDLKSEEGWEHQRWPCQEHLADTYEALTCSVLNIPAFFGKEWTALRNLNMMSVPSILLELQREPPKDIITQPPFYLVPFPEHHKKPEAAPATMKDEWAEMKQHMEKRFQLRFTLLDTIYSFFETEVGTMDKSRQQLALGQASWTDDDKSKLMDLHRTGYVKRKSWNKVVESELMLAGSYEYMSSLVLGIPNQYTEGNKRHVFFLRYLFTVQNHVTNSTSAPDLIRSRRDLKCSYKELYDYVISGGPPDVIDDRLLGRGLGNSMHILENIQSLDRNATYDIEEYDGELDKHNSAEFESVEGLQDKMKEDYGDAMGFLSTRVRKHPSIYSASPIWYSNFAIGLLKWHPLIQGWKDTAGIRASVLYQVRY